MKTSLILGTLALAVQSQACVTLTVKENLKAKTWSWAVWKDGRKEISQSEKGARPDTFFGRDFDEEYSVVLAGQFHQMRGIVRKESSGIYQWDRK
jgi:hypothetical protein